MPGTPRLNLVAGGLITAIFIGVILRLGLLPSATVLATHFILLGAPLTTDSGSWRGGVTVWFATVIVGVTVFAARTATYARYRSMVR